MAYRNESILEGRPHMRAPVIIYSQYLEEAETEATALGSPQYAKLCAQHTAQVFPLIQLCTYSVLLFPFSFLKLLLSSEIRFLVVFLSLQYNALQ